MLPSGMATDSPEKIVRLFLESMATGETETAVSLIDPAITYTNVSLPTLGAGGTRKVLRFLDNPRYGFGVRMINLAVDGPVVLTERIDELRIGRIRSQFWVCGRFEVRDGRITVWRDYFDWLNVTLGMLRGVAALALPGLVTPLPAPGSGRQLRSPDR